MKQAEFCYWLQGPFEIFGEVLPAICEAQLDRIKAHLELVKQCSKTPITGFCAWLDGVLSVVELSEVEGLSVTVVETIKKKLNDEFLHVIDPKMPGDKEVLQAIHDGLQLSSLNPEPPHKPHLARC